MKQAAAMALVLALAGCQTKPVDEMSYTEVKQLAGQIVDRCVAQGIKENTREMTACSQQEARREVVTRQRMRQRQRAMGAALAQGLGDYSQQQQRNAAIAAANRPVNCTSQLTPANTVRTSCY